MRGDRRRKRESERASDELMHERKFRLRIETFTYTFISAILRGLKYRISVMFNLIAPFNYAKLRFFLYDCVTNRPRPFVSDGRKNSHSYILGLHSV